MMMEKPRVMKTINEGGGSQERSLELEPSLSFMSFPQQKSNLRVDASADEDTEISIFDAQRYFNESNSDARVCKRVSPLNMPNLDRISPEPGCDISGLARFSSASSAADGYGYGRTYRARSFHATPTASSEASWNSQTGLLSNPPGAIAVSMTMKNPTSDDKRKASGKIKWFWGRRCPCLGKKSVQVEPKTLLRLNQKLKVEAQKSLCTKSSSWCTDKREEMLLACNPYRISAENNEFHSSLGQRVVASATTRPLMISHGSGTAGFTFPILNQQPTSSHIKVAMNRYNNSLDDHEDPPRDSLEVFRPSEESSSISVSKKLVSRINIPDDDVGSDTSSDLFEIESFTTTTMSQTTSYPMYHRRDSLDDASNFNARRSIAAAGNGSGFGCPYPPMMRECYEPSEASIEWSVTTAEGFDKGSVGVSEAEEMTMTAHGNGGMKKSGGNGGLLSCRCEKAVSVGPNPVKYVPPATKSKHVGNVDKPPLACLSLPFAA
ncbi:protein PHYTOCHROME KINASE SUBSTRATE 4-like [Durio zibethinus]|uniref:Protein PHYTOCHROME KINASE SUBSTRATE 4-like n=1 Tax=Durio zibethinus TaxID=66656 RepID=A0A6P5WW39_DURZI|nr:protein PHYTOCHROME KINASE SUBSTRATE 4-like [Durio zibethinus]